MAQITKVQLIDDLDGSEATESVGFALDGAAYEIDLSEGHAATFREVLEPYLAAGRKVTGRRGSAPDQAAGRSSRVARTSASRSHDGQPDPKQVRAWAQSQGIQVSQRGRVPADLVAQFSAAQ